MALDHTRDYFHYSAQVFQPTDLTQTDIPLFFTRWVTHFCAPTFVLLSGLSIRLRMENVPKADMKRYLLTRGIWLILLEVTVFRFFLLFDLTYGITFFMVLWMIGACMLIMAAIVYLNDRIILALAVLIIAGHNLTDLIQVGNQSWFNIPWTIFLKPGFIPPGLIFTYPVIPWLGVMMLGYWLGRLYSLYAPEQRRKRLIMTGVSMISLFVIIRSVNNYGDPVPWTVIDQPFFTFLSFINTTKYPISFCFALMTIGPTLILLWAFDRSTPRLHGFLHVIGREPLFYFLIHFLLVHSAALALYMIRYGKTFNDINTRAAGNAGLGGIPPGVGFGLLATYVAWILVVVTMYFLCRWYSGYKTTHNNFLTRWI